MGPGSWYFRVRTLLAESRICERIPPYCVMGVVSRSKVEQGVTEGRQQSKIDWEKGGKSRTLRGARTASKSLGNQGKPWCMNPGLQAKRSLAEFNWLCYKFVSFIGLKTSAFHQFSCTRNQLQARVLRSRFGRKDREPAVDLRQYGAESEGQNGFAGDRNGSDAILRFLTSGLGHCARIQDA